MEAQVPKTNLQTFINTILWGITLWLFGYILSFIFFAFIPKHLLGWAIMPFGIVAILWVLIRKIARKVFTCYIGLAIFWTIIAVIFDYLFIVKLLSSPDYYKFDVYLYYLLTFLLPIVVGWIKFHNKAK